MTPGDDTELATERTNAGPPLDLRAVPGLRVGHATDLERITGCTVVLATGGAVAGVDVRGSAPGTRETDLLRPTALVDRIHAVLLAGGSAFGLAAADGAMRWLAKRGVGFETGIRNVPVVPAAVIFDLDVGDATAYPGPEDGYAACVAADAASGPIEGSVGAGTGATVGKLAGPDRATKSGVGSAAVRLPEGLVVGALAVTNALGNVVDGRGRTIAGPRDGAGGYVDPQTALGLGAAVPRANTTLAVIGTDAPLDRAGCRKLAELGHDALAIAIRPVHTMFDGDTVFALSTGSGAPLTGPALVRLGVAAVDVLIAAIERSVLTATSLAGVPSASEGGTKR